MMAAAGLPSSYDGLLQRLSDVTRSARSVPKQELAKSLELIAAQLRFASDGLCNGAAGQTSDVQQSEPSCSTAPAEHDPSPQHVSKKQRKANKPARELDFSLYHQRYVAVEIAYLGGGLHGFARQDNVEETVEGHLFSALRRTRLIPENVEPTALKYSRCGRTDKGVSALGQVVSLLLRSCGKANASQVEEEQEIDYVRVLNRTLPSEIRALGWTTVPDDFNARFSAQARQYKYFIVQQRWPTSGGAEPAAASLDIDRMREAVQHFLGEHDFRNFCKADVTAVKTFRRRVLSFSIDPVGVADSESGCQVFALNLRGTAFLWHQVRCMAAVLLMVGRGQEDPGIVQKLLDIEATPCKPQFTMAAEEPLLLYACEFQDLHFRRTERAVEAYQEVLSAALSRNLVASALVSSMLTRTYSDSKTSVTGEMAGVPRPHVLLSKRPCEPSVEERAQRLGVPWPHDAQAGEPLMAE